MRPRVEDEAPRPVPLGELPSPLRWPVVRPYASGVRFRWLEADLKDAVLGHPRSLWWAGGGPSVGAGWDREDSVPGVLLALGSTMAVVRNRLQRRPLPG